MVLYTREDETDHALYARAVEQLLQRRATHRVAEQ